MLKQWVALLVAAAFCGTAVIALAKDYQVTGPVVDAKENVIVVKKGNENWEIARDKDTKSMGEVKKGDRVTVKYKMIATSIETKETKSKAEAKGKPEEKMKTEAKTK